MYGGFPLTEMENGGRDEDNMQLSVSKSGMSFPWEELYGVVHFRYSLKVWSLEVRGIAWPNTQVI